MSWFFIAIGAYFLYSFVSVLDKVLVSRMELKPKLFAFYVGSIGVVLFLFVPFFGFPIPSTPILLLSIASGIFLILALFWLYKGMVSFEPSRIVPAIGGLVPMLVLFFGILIYPTQAIPSLSQSISLLFLIAGAVLISFEREKQVTIKSLLIAFVSALFFSLSFVLLKYVYLTESFWTGLLWGRLGGVIAALFFFALSVEVRRELFSKKQKSSPSFWQQPKRVALFLLNQGMGAGAGILQAFAIFLAPFSMIAVVNALQGVQYVFLLFLTTLLSWFFPKIVKERITRGIILQKVTAILLIVTGLFIIAFL